MPRLVDLGATKCIPCKMMAPILEGLKKDFAGKLEVEFIDVWEKPDDAQKYGILSIPTQIFFDATGKELFRHEGFFAREDILAQWKELGISLESNAPPLSAVPTEPAFSRWEPATPDTRPKNGICYMCDGDIQPRTRVVLKTEKGDVAFCAPHCYFIMCSSKVPPQAQHDNVMVSDWEKDSLTPARSAFYVRSMGADNRPVIRAFSTRDAAEIEQKNNGGELFEISALQEQEMAARCGFCDRVVYPVDAYTVKVDGLATWGCCPMCALGVAARMQKDIDVMAKDALTGAPIHVITTNGHVGMLEPQSAVAWAGSKKTPEGKVVSTGCFKQAFFINEENLKNWVEQHPTATGRMIPIEQALTEKMALSAEQISKACKIGECTPK